MNFNIAQYVDLNYFTDERGYFTETLNISKRPFNQRHYIQSNLSVNKMGVLRGMHYQKTKPQGKLCSVLAGAAFDFVIDLRKSSPDFKKVQVFFLEAKKPAVWVPPGFAHGFLSCRADTIFSYHVFDNSWFKDDECSINPLTVPEIQNMVKTRIDLIVSPKDLAGYDFTTDDYPQYD